MSTPQQAALKRCTEGVHTKKCKTSRSMATVLSELSTMLCVSMAGGGGLPTGETSQSCSSGSGSDKLGTMRAMERGEERSRAMVPGTTEETMAKYGFHFSNEKRNGPLNVMHRFIKGCLEGILREADLRAVWDHPLWSKLLTRATITKSMPISKVGTKMVPLMSFFKDWENALRSGLGLKVLSSAETSEPKDLLLCQVGRLVKKDKVPGVASLWSYHTSFKHLLDRLSETASGELCDGLLFALKCMVAQYVSCPDWNNTNQVVSVVCAIIRGDTGELLRLVSEFGTHMIEYKQMREHGFALSSEGSQNALGAMHRFILHCFKTLNSKIKLNRYVIQALWTNPVWSRLLRHANVTQGMGMSTIRDQFLASIMSVMKHVENSVRSQLGLKPLVLPVPQESFVVCRLARLIELCRSSGTSDLAFDTEVTSLKVLIDKQSISVTETPGSSHAKGVEWLEKLSDLKVGMNDFETECEKLVSSVLDDAFKFDVDEIASTSAVRVADLLEAKAGTEALAKIKYNQYLTSRMTEAGLGMSSRSFFGLIQFLFGTQIKTPDSRAYSKRRSILERCSVWRSLLHRVESMEGEHFSPEKLVEQLYEAENRLRRHFGLETIVKDPSNLRNEEAFVVFHLAKLFANIQSGEENTTDPLSVMEQLMVWKSKFDQCFPTLPASHHLLKSTFSSIGGNCDGLKETVSQAMNAVCRLIQSEDTTGADVTMEEKVESKGVSAVLVVPIMVKPFIPSLSVPDTDLLVQNDHEELFNQYCRPSLTYNQEDDWETLEPTIQSLYPDDQILTPTVQSMRPEETEDERQTMSISPAIHSAFPSFASAFSMMAPSSLTIDKLIDSCQSPLSAEMRKRAMEEMDAESVELLKRKCESQSGPSMKR